MKNNYKLLIFDLDDTLIDNTENVKYAFQKTMEHQNAPHEEENFMKRYHLDRDFRRDRQNWLITLPEDLREETGKKSDRFLDWLRAQRFLMYFDHTISLEKAIELNHIYIWDI